MKIGKKDAKGGKKIKIELTHQKIPRDAIWLFAFCHLDTDKYVDLKVMC